MNSYFHIRAVYSNLTPHYSRTLVNHRYQSHCTPRHKSDSRENFILCNIELADLFRTIVLISNPIFNSDNMDTSNPATSAQPEDNNQQQEDSNQRQEDSTQRQEDSLEDPDFIGLDFVASDMGGMIPLQVFKQSLFRVASDNYLTPERIERFPGRPLFVYGSLMLPYTLAEKMSDSDTPVTKLDAAKVALSMTIAGLQGYRQLKAPDGSIVAITNEEARPDDIVAGMIVFGVSDRQVQCLDRYHDGKYSREPVHVQMQVRCRPNCEELELRPALVNTYIWASDEKLAGMSPGKSLPVRIGV